MIHAVLPLFLICPSPGERRVSIDRAPGSQYNIFIHPYPYPSDLARVDLDTLNPSLYVIGNPRDYEYWFFAPL